MLFALLVTAITMALWEFNWRAKGYQPALEDNKALWAVQRSKVDRGTKSDVILLGSSKVLFDIQLEVWENETGLRPIQLASAGASPLPSFHDIVNNTGFNGTVIVGVTPGLFFSTTFPLASPWNRIQTRVNHFYERTYAQRLNHMLDIPLQNTFAFLASDEEEWSDDLNLKNLVRNMQLGQRLPPGRPPFYRFGQIDLDRNTRMLNKTVKDSSFARSVIEVWKFFGSTSPPPDKASTMAFFLQDVKKFKKRGGQLILLRCPSSAGLKMGEQQVFPRADFWDELVNQAKVPGYHFEDYKALNQFFCPEWSHLSALDADTFTRELLIILKKDQLIAHHKI